MYGYSSYSDMSKYDLLARLDQQKIFKSILNLSEINLKRKMYKSPIREDKEGRCFFDYNNGILHFIDYGNPLRTHLDCVEMVRILKGINIYKAITLLSTEQSITFDTAIINEISSDNTSNFNKVIVPKRRPFNSRDVKFWSKSLIYEKELSEDNVFPVSSYQIITENHTRTIQCYSDSYAICFPNGHVKIYSPYDRRFKFLGTQDNNDIGNLENIDATGDTLILTKAYKDHKVFKNILNTKNVIWFHNEGCIPNDDLLIDILKRFKEVIIFYDNDEPGIIASKKVKDYLLGLKIHDNIVEKSIPKKDNVKDLSDYIYKNGRLATLQLLKKLKIK